MAESWEIKDNGERYVFQLKKDVFWHDGEEFTADDVKFTIDALKDKDVTSPYKEYVEYIRSCKIVDKYSIEIIFHDRFKEY